MRPPPALRSPSLGTLGLLLVIGCSAERNAGLDGNPADPERVELSPSEGAVVVGDTIRFVVDVVRRDGTRERAVVPRFEPTGGTIDATGLYRAAASPGRFVVRAVVLVAAGLELAGEASVQVAPAPPVVEGVEVVPDSVDLPVGGEQGFRAEARLSDGTRHPVAVAWRATGGVIDSSGRFTAGSVALKASVVGSVTIAGRLWSDSQSSS